MNFNSLGNGVIFIKLMVFIEGKLIYKYINQIYIMNHLKGAVNLSEQY